jgi:photosystem II stability/assembly factor-like uncharacterized protein
LSRAVARILLAFVLPGAGLWTPALSQDSPGGGERSLLMPLAEKSLLLGGDYADGRAIVVGERGHVLISDDDGRSWRQVQVPSRATLTGVHLHDGRLGWAVGHDATILRTRDGGESWERVYHDPDEESPLFDVWFFDADSGFAVGAYGLFLATSDGGSTWDRRTLGEYDDYHLHHVARSATGRLYMAAEAGVIYRSDDDGKEWVSLPSPYEGSLFGTLPLDGDALMLFGLRGHVFRSEDAGESWEEIETGTVATINRGLRSSDGSIVLVGHQGTLLLSDDEGRSFTRRELPDRRALATVMRTDDDGWITIGDRGVARLEALDAGEAQ